MTFSIVHFMKKEKLGDTKKSIDRKPGNGMILKSLKKWNINKKVFLLVIVFQMNLQPKNLKSNF